MDENSRSFRSYLNRDSEEFSFPTLASLKAAKACLPATPSKNPQPRSPARVAAESPAVFIQESVDGLEGLITNQPPPSPQAVQTASQVTDSSDVMSLIPLTTPDDQTEEVLDTLPEKRISLASLPSDLVASPEHFFRRTRELSDEHQPSYSSPDRGSRTLQESFLDFLPESQPPQSSQSEEETGWEAKRRRLDSSICVVVAPERSVLLTEQQALEEVLGWSMSAPVNEGGGTTVLPRMLGSLSAETEHEVFLLTERILEKLEKEIEHKLDRAPDVKFEERTSVLVEELSRRRGEAEFVKKMGELVRQVELQMEARIERKFVEEVELQFGEYLGEVLSRKCGETSESAREKRALREELVKKLGKLWEKLERKKENINKKEKEVERVYKNREEEIQNIIENKKNEKFHVIDEIKAYEIAVRDQTLSTKDLYRKKLENFKLFKEHFLRFGWTVCRDGIKELIIQIPRVRLLFQVIQDERGNHKIVEYKKLVEGPYNFLNSSMVNFPLTGIVKNLVEAQLPASRKITFSPEYFSQWAGEAIRTASAIEELALTVQNVGELLETCRWIDRPKSLLSVRSVTHPPNGPSRRGTRDVGGGGVLVEVWVCNYKQQLRLNFGIPSLAHTDSELLAQELSLSVRVVGPCHPELKTQLVENLKTTKSAWARRLEGIESAVDAALKLFKHW